MGLLDSLLSDSAGKAQAEDFAQRYQQGDPSEGYSEKEALDQHQNIAQHLSSDQYERAAVQAFERLTPQQRKQFHQQIAHHLPATAQQGRSQNAQSDDPGSLAKLVGGLHQQNPGMLGSILGGGGSGGGLLGGSVGKAVLGGIAAMAIKQARGH
jgi:hypothetical protein